MRSSKWKPRPGDLVEVRSPAEILTTLDGNGALGGLPFMPEMLDCCGRTYKVEKQVVKSCMSGGASTVRSIKADDVFTLENLRCDGSAHDGCRKRCLIFWRAAWLRRADPHRSTSGSDREGRAALERRLKTRIAPNRYFCQASELPRYTMPLSRFGRLTTCVRDITAGNSSPLEMARRISLWSYWRLRRKFVGEFARGSQHTTPAAKLGLKANDRVVVRSIDDVRGTTNHQARNRGLYFSPDMGELCGHSCRVLQRADKIIVDGTGEMRTLNHTVFLDGSFCGCSHLAFGGCPRHEFMYWREIWLDKETPASATQ